MKDKKRKLLTIELEGMERWKEHFTEVLSRPEPDIKANITTNNINELDIDTSYITDEEITRVIKNNTTAGNDCITEVLKADIV